MHAEVAAQTAPPLAEGYLSATVTQLGQLLERAGGSQECEQVVASSPYAGASLTRVKMDSIWVRVAKVASIFGVALHSG